VIESLSDEWAHSFDLRLRPPCCGLLGQIVEHAVDAMFEIMQHLGELLRARIAGLAQ
jgi:hypothetical protein